MTDKEIFYVLKNSKLVVALSSEDVMACVHLSVSPQFCSAFSVIAAKALSDLDRISDLRLTKIENAWLSMQRRNTRDEWREAVVSARLMVRDLIKNWREE